jgi:hypothetical protein
LAGVILPRWVDTGENTRNCQICVMITERKKRLER